MITASPPAEMEEYVGAEVRTGDYSCGSEMVLHGLFLLQDRDTLRQIKLDRLRKDIAVGLEQADRGELAPLDVEAIIAEGRERLASRNER
jgi:antitoxin ParD1/3/4